MSPNLELARELLRDARYPRTATYDPDWMVSLALGCPTLWLLESLCQEMGLQPGMRVLDLGCGKAGGSIFLAKEYGVQVWAADLWVSPHENWSRICEAGMQHCIFPIHAEAHNLPFAENFFDAVIGINSLQYFATNDMYLRQHLTKLVRPGGQFGIVVPGFYREIGNDFPSNVPGHLLPHWESCHLYSWHTADWWRWHWQKTNQVNVLLADTFPDREGYETYLRWERILQYDIRLAEEDAGRTITFVRLVARKKESQTV